MKKNLVQSKNKNSYAPRLSEEQINKIVSELSDSNLSPISVYAEEELLLLRVLERKLQEGTIKAEMSDDGKLWLKTNKPVLGGITQIKYQAASHLKNLLRSRKYE